MEIKQAMATRAAIHRDLPDPAMRRALRLDAGLTLREVAEVVGCSVQAVHCWEVGRRRPRGVLLERYVEALRALRSASNAA